ncbi:MAG: indole-3-glycerol phosphate synthase [Chthonomonas sp.]
MSDRLREIFATKREEVRLAKTLKTTLDLQREAHAAPAPLGFIRALEQAPQPVALIAEVKQASPSQGTIRAGLDPVEVATAYQRAGAHTLSVLTDEVYFQGSPENLRRAKAATGVPCLRKDFVFDRYQLLEARAWGADAVLLIVAGLDPGLLQELYGEAIEFGLDVLVEVHDEDELKTALRLKPKLVGVNNRNLSTFKTDLAVSERLIPWIPEGVLAVSESALRCREDIERVQAAGARAVLIGTEFCSAPDVAARVREVMGW